ncbi:hypothetical protein PG997_008739 [Apiospora hydei]|uniref:Uncharacterized protein n=1 Tax=Apiospora hydei TaxID=1337664 RepID=A0ABR1WBN8_9PEZI
MFRLIDWFANLGRNVESARQFPPTERVNRPFTRVQCAAFFARFVSLGTPAETDASVLVMLWETVVEREIRQRIDQIRRVSQTLQMLEDQLDAELKSSIRAEFEKAGDETVKKHSQEQAGGETVKKPSQEHAAPR